MADGLQRLRNLGLQIDNPDFLNEYQGVNLAQGQFIYKVRPEGVQFLGHADSNKTAQFGRPDFRYTSDIAQNSYGVSGAGLRPQGKESWQTSEAYRYFNPESGAYQKAASNNFGMGVQPKQSQYTGHTSSINGRKVYMLDTGTWTSAAPTSPIQEQQVPLSYQWTGQTEEPKVDIPKGTMDAAILEGDKKGAEIRQDLNKQQQKKQRVLETYERMPDAIANEAFIQAVAQARFGRPATADELAQVGTNQFGLVGASVADVVRRFGLDQDFGVSPQKATLFSPEGQKVVVDVGSERASDLQSQGYSLSQPTVAPETTGTTETDTQLADMALGEQASSEQKSTFQKIIDSVRNLLGIKKEAFGEASEEVGLEEKSQKIQDIQTQIQDRREFYEQQEQQISGETIPQAQINRQLNNLSKQKNSEMADLEIREAIATGAYDRAKEIAQGAADDAYEAAKLEIDALELQGELEQSQIDAMYQTIENQRDLLKDGYIPLTEEEAQQFDVTELLTDPETGNTYLRPQDDRDTQVITAGGRKLLVDKQTAEVLKDFGGAYKGGASKLEGIDFSNNDRSRLIAAGFTSSEIEQLKNNLDQFGYEEVAKDLNDEQKSVLSDVLKGVTTAQAESRGELSSSEREVVSGINGLLLDGASEKEIEEYITLKGYEPLDFSEYYKGKTNEEEENTKWYNPLTWF